MSTRLLSQPGKDHELWDDLESLWFVLLFEGLHFAKHNKPDDIDMALIFDQARLCPKTGTHTGGLGKRELYAHMYHIMNRNLEFESKPFTALIRRIYRMFASLHAYYVAKDRDEPIDVSHEENFGKLKNCVEMKSLLTEALSSEGWPEVCDKVEDQYPPTKNLTFEQKDTVAAGYVNTPSPYEPSKRKREEEEEVPISPTKRSRTDLPPLM